MEMRRDELVSPRSSAALRLGQSQDSELWVTSLCETHEEWFGQRRWSSSPRLKADRQKVLHFLQALSSTQQGLPTELEEPVPSFSLLCCRLVHTHARTHAHTVPGRERLCSIAGVAPEGPSDHAKSGQERRRVSRLQTTLQEFIELV